MPDPRTQMKGLPNLGAAIDERIEVSNSRMLTRPGSTVPRVPISQGGYPGGSGQSDEPVMPEAWVTSLRSANAPEALSGDLVVAGSGEITVIQSAATPHFTINSPTYTAADGVVRTGNEFHLDTTVVRVDGDQSIGGVKSFQSFPQTPQATPNLDYDVVNKKYVDDQVTTDQLWQRSFNVLSPKYSDDELQLSNCLKFNLNSATSGILYSFVVSESHPRFTLQTNGLCCWGDGSSFDTILLRHAAGILGMERGHAFRVGEYGESNQRASAPGVPSNGFSRLFHAVDTRAYSIEPGGVVHDLCVAHKQVFPATGGAAGSAAQLAYYSTVFPSWAILPPDFTASGIGSIAWASGAGQAQLLDTYADFYWTSAAQEGGIIIGAQVALAAACRRMGATVTIHARLKVNAPARLSAVFLSLNDTGSNTAASTNLVGNLSADTWYDAILSNVDTSGWSEDLRLVLTVQGTDNASHAGTTQLCVESLSIEQWAK